MQLDEIVKRFWEITEADEDRDLIRRPQITSPHPVLDLSFPGYSTDTRALIMEPQFYWYDLREHLVNQIVCTLAYGPYWAGEDTFDYAGARRKSVNVVLEHRDRRFLRKERPAIVKWKLDCAGLKIEQVYAAIAEYNPKENAA